jgi:cytochrome c551
VRKYIGIALLLAVSFGLLAACGGGTANKPSSNPSSSSPSPTAESNEAYVKAEELFKKTNCISCHGVNLEGRVGPATNLQKIGGSKTKEQIANQISNGGGGMPVYKTKLSEDEINLLADWLSSKK